MKTIGVFFGGKSTEHDVSIITGQMIISALTGLDYNVVPIYIYPDGDWSIDPILGKLKTFVEGKDLPKNGMRLNLNLEKSHGKIVFKNKGLTGKEVVIDIAFPALHGNFGEDGTIQGLFEMFGVPYVGCGVASSAMAMDKAFTKQICSTEGLSITKFVAFNKDSWDRNKTKILKEIDSRIAYPKVIKPVHLGSSIGIARATNAQELIDKIEVAFFYDDKILVEEFVENLMDITCCVIGNGSPIPSELQESIFNSHLFSFEDKYLNDGGTQFGKAKSGIHIPARISETLTKKIKDASVKTYKALGCSGIARIDLLLDAKNDCFYVNEVNPLPGTLYHHLWEKSGIKLQELLERLITLAEEKSKQKGNLVSVFKSSILTNLKSTKLSKGES